MAAYGSVAHRSDSRPDVASDIRKYAAVTPCGSLARPAAHTTTDSIKQSTASRGKGIEVAVPFFASASLSIAHAWRWIWSSSSFSKMGHNQIGAKPLALGQGSQGILLAIAAAFVLWATLFIFESSVVGFDGLRRFCLFDDAMISMRYAWNLSHAKGLVWNEGEYVEGITNMLMTLYMAFATLLFDKSRSDIIQNTIITESGIVAFLFNTALNDKTRGRAPTMLAKRLATSNELLKRLLVKISRIESFSKLCFLVTRHDTAV